MNERTWPLARSGAQPRREPHVPGPRVRALPAGHTRHWLASQPLSRRQPRVLAVPPYSAAARAAAPCDDRAPAPVRPVVRGRDEKRCVRAGENVIVFAANVPATCALIVPRAEPQRAMLSARQTRSASVTLSAASEIGESSSDGRRREYQTCGNRVQSVDNIQRLDFNRKSADSLY